MAALGVTVGPRRVSNQPQMVNDLAQPERVQLGRGVQQGWFGVGDDLVGEVVDALGEYPGMGRGDHPSSQGVAGRGQRTPEQRPSRPHGAGGRASSHPQPAPQPGGRGANLDALFSPGSTPGVQVGQVLEPVALQPIQQPPQLQDLLGPDRVSQPAAVLGVQAVHGRGQGGQPARPPGRRTSRIGVRVHDRNLSTPQPKATTKPKSGDNSLPSTHPGAWH
jgi:hypothetical protein